MPTIGNDTRRLEAPPSTAARFLDVGDLEERARLLVMGRSPGGC
jgi:hypothetical protein